MLITTEILTQNFTQIFTDHRDGNKYPLISTKNRYWLNANLNYHTDGSSCLDDKEENCKSLGRLYSFQEAQDVCPTNWKLPTVDDFRELFMQIAIEEKGEENGTFTFPYSWEHFNSTNLANIKINQNGMKHKKKYISHESFNLWLRTSPDNDATHIHGYEYKIKKNKQKDTRFIIFPHRHKEKRSSHQKSKLGVRCVIPISEFNKLTIGNG